MGVKFLIKEACRAAKIGHKWPLRVCRVSEIVLTVYLVAYAASMLSVTGWCMAELRQHVPVLFNNSLIGVPNETYRCWLPEGCHDFLDSWQWLNRSYSIGEIVGGIKERPP
jgi:hypothetical protein